MPQEILDTAISGSQNNASIPNINKNLSMKALLFSLLTLVVPVSVCAQNAKVVFVIPTADYEWPDGEGCLQGDAYRAFAAENENYLIETSIGGPRYPLPKRIAKIATAEQAALALLKQRDEMYSYMAKLTALLEREKQAQQQPASPQAAQAEKSSQVKAGVLSRADRTRMLRTIRSEKMISSIRDAERLTDDQILALYEKAKASEEARALRQAIQNANQ